MRFLLVTSLITTLLILAVSASAIAAFSWMYTGSTPSKKTPDLRIEIRWGEGS